MGGSRAAEYTVHVAVLEARVVLPRLRWMSKPALSGTRAGQRQAQDGALPGEPGRVRVLVQAPH